MSLEETFLPCEVILTLGWALSHTPLKVLKKKKLGTRRAQIKTPQESVWCLIRQNRRIQQTGSADFKEGMRGGRWVVREGPMNGDEAGTLLKKQNAPVLEPKKSKLARRFQSSSTWKRFKCWQTGAVGRREQKQNRVSPVTARWWIAAAFFPRRRRRTAAATVYVSAVSVEIHGFLEKSTRQEVERESLCQQSSPSGLSLGSQTRLPVSVSFSSDRTSTQKQHQHRSD